MVIVEMIDINSDSLCNFINLSEVYLFGHDVLASVNLDVTMCNYVKKWGSNVQVSQK